MGTRRHRRRSLTGATALVASLLVLATLASIAGAAEGTETSGDFARQPVKELSDVPGPALLGKDFVLLGVARRDDDFLRDNFGLRKFALDGKEDTAFSDAANTPPYLPRGGRRLGNSFHDLAGKLDMASARSLRNYPNRVVAGPEGGWLLVGRVGGDEGKVIPALLKVKDDGTIDTSFGKNGRAVLPARHRTQGITAAAIVGAKDKRLWIGLPAPGGMGIARLDAKGAFDSTFGDDGMLFVEREGCDLLWPQRLVPQADGSVSVLACAGSRMRKHAIVARVTPAGKLETEKFGGDKGKGGWTALEQTACETWTYSPRTGGRLWNYYFAADAWAVAGDRGTLTLAVDGQDAKGDKIDAVFGAKALNWRKDIVGIVRLAENGMPDTGFGQAGVVPLEPPDAYKATVGGMAAGKGGVLWLAAILKNREGARIGWARVDAKGKRLPWSKIVGKSVAVLDGDWLLFPLEKGRDLTVRSLRVDEDRAMAFGFSAGREPGDTLRWKLWRAQD